MNLSPHGHDRRTGAAGVLRGRVHHMETLTDNGGRMKVERNAAAYVPFAGNGKLCTNNKGKFLLKESREPAVELCQVAANVMRRQRWLPHCRAPARIRWYSSERNRL